MRGPASLELLVLDTQGAESEAPHLAFAPALDVKIDAAPGRKFDPLSNLGKLVLLSPRCSPPFPRRLLTLGLGASTGTK